VWILHLVRRRYHMRCTIVSPIDCALITIETTNALCHDPVLNQGAEGEAEDGRSPANP
jgi:hypothetical protein